MVAQQPRFLLTPPMLYSLSFFFKSGHGQHLTGLGHVKDLARAMANVLGKECVKGQVYNVQVGVFFVLQPLLPAVRMPVLLLVFPNPVGVSAAATAAMAA